MLAVGYEPVARRDWNRHELECLHRKRERIARHTQVQLNIGAAGRTDDYKAESRLTVPEGFDIGHWIRYSTLGLIIRAKVPSSAFLAMDSGLWRKATYILAPVKLYIVVSGSAESKEKQESCRESEICREGATEKPAGLLKTRERVGEVE